MSKRQYINEAYLLDYLGSQSLSSDFGSADELIEFAEEFIDGYVGNQRKWFQLDGSFVAGIYSPPDYEPETPVVKELRGRINAVTDYSNYTLEQWQHSAYQNGFFQGCNLDIIGGTGMGNCYVISGSTYVGNITLVNTDGSAISATGAAPLDTTSIYRIYQLGKFPRDRDVFYNTFTNPTQYYKAIPDVVRQATAAQCEFINRQGIAFFTSDAAYLTGEHIGSYSYTRDPKAGGTNFLIAPKAQLLLKGIMNRKGRMIV
jgi:hypothetical protein